VWPQWPHPAVSLFFFLAFVFPKKNLDNSDFSWRCHFLMLSKSRCTTGGIQQKPLLG
jgi:hypothetical protein